MYEGLSFDELNKLHAADHEPRSMPYDQYFGEMDISREQKQKRIDIAEKLEDIFLALLMTMFYAYTEGAPSVYMNAINETKERYLAFVAATGVAVSDYFTSIHIPSVVDGIVGTTIAHPEDMFNFTFDRAMLIAENEANSFWNDAEFTDAVATGKRRKTWHTIIDKRTRGTHRNINGVTKPITEPFEVGNYFMMYPRDETLGAGSEEIANCRCSVSYS